MWGPSGGRGGGHSHVEPAQLHLLVSLEPEPWGSLKQDVMTPALCLERSLVLSGGPTWGESGQRAVRRLLPGEWW